MRQNKYLNVKHEVDGIVFDSKKEAHFYQELKLRRAAGDIRDFTCQPVYELLPATKTQWKTYRRLTYRADFQITHNDGTTEIVDVKGFQTEVFKVKEKLFAAKYPHLKLTII